MMFETKRGRRADNDIAIPSDVEARDARRDRELERAFARRRRELEALFAA